MSALLGMVNIFGLMVLFTSIGGDAIGLGVAAVLIVVGSAGKAIIDNRHARATQASNEHLVTLIQAQHELVDERLAKISVDVTKLGIRISDLEETLTAPNGKAS